MVFHPAGDAPPHGGFFEFKAEAPQHFLGHPGIAGRFQSPRQTDLTGPGQKGQRQHQSGNILGADIPRQGKSAGGQPPGKLDLPGVLPHLGSDAVSLQSGQKGLHRAPGQPAPPGKYGPQAQGSRHRQQKAQGAAAFPAVQPEGRGGRPRNRGDQQAVFPLGKAGSHLPQAVHGGQQIAGSGQPRQKGFPLGHRRQNKGPVPFGFGKRHRRPPGGLPRANRDLHRPGSFLFLCRGRDYDIISSCLRRRGAFCKGINCTATAGAQLFFREEKL